MAFEARTATRRGTMVLNGEVGQAFAHFSPMGERAWVEGWDPEVLAPADAAWAEGMIFRTAMNGREGIWVVASLDVRGHHVVYYRTEPNRLVARVEVQCRPLPGRRTEATVAYSYVGLSTDGNAEIAAVTDAAYDARMQSWQKAINGLPDPS